MSYDYIYPCDAHHAGDYDGTFAGHVARGSVNPGMDYPCVYGSDVVAVSDGTIDTYDDNNDGSGGRFIQYTDHYGNRHQDLHLSQIIVKSGRIRQGQVIAKSGASAYGSDWGTGGPHDHHSLRIDGVNVDPELYIPGAGGNAVPVTPTTPTKKRRNEMALGVVRNIHNPDGSSQNFLFVPGFQPNALANDDETRQVIKLTGQNIDHLNDDSFVVADDLGLDSGQLKLVTGILGRGVRL